MCSMRYLLVRDPYSTSEAQILKTLVVSVRDLAYPALPKPRRNNARRKRATDQNRPTSDVEPHPEVVVLANLAISFYRGRRVITR